MLDNKQLSWTDLQELILIVYFPLHNFSCLLMNYETITKEKNENVISIVNRYFGTASNIDLFQNLLLTKKVCQKPVSYALLSITYKI